MFRIPDIPKIQNFKPIGQGWNFANSVNFVQKRKIAEFFYSGYPIYPKVPNFKQIGQGWNFANSEFRAKTKNRRIFLLVPLYSEYPIYPIQNFKRIGQSWKFDPFLGRPKFREFSYFEKFKLFMHIFKHSSIIMQSFIKLSYVTS